MTDQKAKRNNGRDHPAVAITGRPGAKALQSLRAHLPADWPCYAVNCRARRLPAGFSRLDADAESLPALASALAKAEPDRDWIIVEAGLELPELALERLARVGAADDVLAAVCALTNQDDALNPLPPGLHPGRAIDVKHVDRLVYALGRRSWFEIRAPAGCVYWRAAALAAVASAETDPIRHLRQAGWSMAAADHVFVAESNRPIEGPPGDAEDEPPAALAVLRDRVGEALQSGTAPASVAGLAAQPVLLHIAHSWGGGVERFCRDLIAADGARQHLVLAAAGDSAERSYGRVLRLYAGTQDAPVIREWRLPAPVHSIEASAPGYAAVLEQIISDFAVDQVLVSSLIGHSLEVLETGLPTAVVLHDYFPVCPALNIYFGETCRSCERDRLGRCLATNPYNRLFIDKDAKAWLRIRDAFVQRILERRIPFAVPSDSVRRHLVAIEPRLTEAAFTRIPHGLADWRDPKGPRRPAQAGRLQLVVPGRLKSGKGRDLLRRALPRLTQHVDIWLVGCGKETGEFLAQNGVHLIFDYERERLPKLLRMIQPHAGLLLSTVPETFGYTLSELWSLGVPPIACNLGAFAERIRDGDNGLLVDPDPDSLVAAVKRLCEDGGLLERLWDDVARREIQGLAAMAEGYRQLLPPPETPPCRYRLNAPGPDLLVEQALRAELASANRELARQTRQLKEADRELLRRASWAKRTEKELEERTRWARSLQADLERERHRVLERQDRIETLTRQLQEARAAHRAAEAAYREVIASRSWRWTAPLRAATIRLRRIRDALRFRWLSITMLARRVARSLRVRGLTDTLRRIRHQRPVAARKVTRPTPPLPEPGPLTVASADQPRASIVIPVYNNSRLTFACLASIAKHAGDVPFEVIVVDDASSDDTQAVLAGVEGVRVLRNDTNVGFIDTCNRGATEARGEYLVFLNNDTTVTEGWLTALLDTFDRVSDAGLVGARLIYPDGRLQEAGGIVFSDGSGWNYGRGDDPDRPEYCFLREADYCSGACIAIRRELFAELDGFDTRYRPAYYEDTDLAFRVRGKGHRVLYQPECVVIHHEGASSGTATSSGIKRYQVLNQEKFRQRWAEALAQHPASGSDLYRARQHRLNGRVLIVDALVPEPDQDSGSLRMNNLIRVLLKMGYGVTFLPGNLTALQPYTSNLQQMGVEVLYLPGVSSPPEWLARHGRHFDAVWLCRHYVAVNFIRLVRRHCPNARVLFDTIDLHYLRERRQAELENSDALMRTAERTRREELGVARAADVTLVVSPFEKDVLAREAPDLEVAVLSNIHQVPGRRTGFAQRRDIWFVGGFQHPPNVDAVRWFCADVLPLVRSRLPALTFHIVGSKMPPEVERLAGEGVRVHGFVPDVSAFLEGCRLSVAPLRYGAGVKGKVNMAMAHGQPVVATSTAVEGMNVRPGADALVADDADAFADAVVHAYEDEALWLRLSDNGLENVRRYFSFEAARDALSGLLAHAGDRSHKAVS